MNDILMCVAASGVFFGAIILRGIFGYLKNKKISVDNLKFDWKKFLSGSIKPILLTLAIGGLAGLILAFLGLVDASGIEVLGIEQVSIQNLLVGLFIADLGAIGYAISEALMAFGLTDKQIAQIRETAFDGDIDDDLGVSLSLDENGGIIAEACLVRHDKGDGKVTEEKEAEKLKQLGAFPYYKVDISTPSAFVNAVNGKGFNEGYGIQCVAGFKEFTYSLCGRVLACAGGGANGYARQRGDIEAMGFTYYNDRNLKDGDWVIFGNGTYGHVAMYYQGKFFGQNQGAANASVGSPFNLMSLSLNSYLCHYRPNIYKGSTPAPAPSKKSVDDAVVNAVLRGDYGNGQDRINALTAAGYNYNDVQAAVNARIGGGSSTPSSNAPKIGDRVMTSSQTDQNGAYLNLRVINDGQSVWTETNGRGYAVLCKGRTVRCAVSVESLRKA